MSVWSWNWHRHTEEMQFCSAFKYLYCFPSFCFIPYFLCIKKLPSSVFPLEKKCTSHILIKVAALPLEIRDFIFKLSITLRLSGLKDPVIQIRCYKLLCMAIWLHFGFGLSLSGRQWGDLVHSGKYKCVYLA